MKTPGYDDIGDLLRSARKERDMELPQVAQALHIRVRYLDALECGRLSDLPGLSYAKGYLQVYAGHVGLDKEEILRRFENVEEQVGRRGFYLPQVFRKEKTPDRGAMWGALGVAALAYMAWLVLLHPPRLSISLIEPFPEEHAEYPSIVRHDTPCLYADPALYPPCTMVRQPWVSLISLQARTNVVTDPATQQNASQ